MDIKVSVGSQLSNRRRNIDQIRAATAFEWRDKIRKAPGGGSPRAIAKKVPTQIIQNGLLGALAFAIENANTGYEDVFKAILDHLAKAELNYGVSCDSLQHFLEGLCEKNDAEALRAVTSESLAFLNFLRRFVESGKGD